MIDALIISAQEPQLLRCLESVWNQASPFDTIIHIDNVVPESKAFKEGVDKLVGEWVLLINGDMILYENACETCKKYIWQDEKAHIGEYQFGLWDTFVFRVINSCSLFNVEALRSTPREDQLRNDMYASHRIRKKGWNIRSLFDGNNRVVIGSHFDLPDEFQIFRRFYITAVKKNRQAMRIVTKLYNQSKNPLYALAMEAWNFGYEKKEYPGSHNIDFDRKMYESFCKGIK